MQRRDVTDGGSDFGALAETGVAEKMAGTHARLADELRERIVGADR